MSEGKRFLRWWLSKRDFGSGVAALVAGLVLVVGACGVLGGDFGGSELDSLDAPCRDTLGHPLKARDVIAAFEAEGFTMHSLPASFYCNPGNFGGGVASVADVSNRRSVTMDDEVVDQQGWASCHVAAEGRGAPYELHADLNRGADSPIYAGTKAVFDLANVDCSLYPPDRNAELWVERAHAAMKRLARQLQR